MTFKSLIGKMIKSASLLDNKTTLVFITTDKKKIIYEASGECCSESWIEHMDEIPENSIVNKIVEKNVNCLEETEDELIEQYFYELVTDKGIFSIEMRNSNNGYYGGSIYEVNQKYYDQETQ